MRRGAPKVKKSEPMFWVVELRAGDRRSWGLWSYATKEEAVEGGKMYGCPFEAQGVCRLEFDWRDKLLQSKAARWLEKLISPTFDLLEKVGPAAFILIGAAAGFCFSAIVSVALRLAT